MALLIQHGEVITATDRYRADIYCEDETITRIEPDIPRASLPGEAEVIDAEGKYVFPGFIDPHVHIHLPFMGTLAKDDYESASQAALVGGTTTLIEMICPGSADDPLEAFETWNAKAAPLAAVDYTFHMSVVRFDPLAQAQFREIVTQKGIPSFKVFLAYKGALNLSDEELFGTLSLAKELGVIVTAHCENAEVIEDVEQVIDTLLAAAGTQAQGGDAEQQRLIREGMRKNASKRVLIRVKPERVVSWDHSKLGGVY